MNAITSAPASGRLPPRRYIGYGLGDFAFNFYWLPLQVFLLKYYTDVLGLDSAAAGLIVMVCLIWDGLVDPLIGIVANKTRTRFGRYRPYMLFGAIPLAASFSLVFLPVPFHDTSLIIYALATQLLFRTVYAAVNIPYGAMMASMTRDSMERNWLSGARMLFAFSGSAVVGYFTPRLVAYIGISNPDSAYFWSAAILSTLATLVIFLSYAMTEERLEPVSEQQRHPPIGELLRMLAKNTPFLQAAAAIALFGFASTVTSASLAYYVQYYMHGELTMTGDLVSMIPFVQMLAILPWTLISRRIGKRAAWISGLLIATAALIALHLVGRPDTVTLFVLIGITAFGSASIAVNFWSIVPDTVEYGEWRSGVRVEGFVFGLVTLIQKSALGVSSAFVGLYLTWIGYVPNQAQSESTVEGLRYMITLFPMAGMLASCAVMLFYRLDAPTHARLVAEIAARTSPQAAR
ncbi:MAG: MFS transporter [Xanthomonadales bacterium]|nr:MFS transporter [Xanthomonadales bacterium]